MDPKVCLRRIFDSIDSCEYDEIVQASSDLLCWILRGGEVPIIDSALSDKLASALARAADRIGENEIL